MIVIDLKGAEGYLDGSIVCPVPASKILTITVMKAPGATSTTASPTPSPIITPISETYWDSLTPSIREWKAYNAWTKMLLLFNTTELTGLGIDTSGIAVDAWKTYMDLYNKKTLVEQLNAETKLRNTFLTANGDFPAHITLLRKKLTHARLVGAEISDGNFVAIVLNSLSSTWDSIVATVFKHDSSSEIIVKLHAWWLRVYKNRNVNTSRGITALYASTSQHYNQNQLICTNPKCNQRGHMIDICYWQEERKEGQFSPGFGKRGGEKDSVIETHQNGFKSKPTANIATITDEVEHTFALMTIEETTFKVSHILVPVPSKIPNDNPFPSSYNYMYQGMGMESNKELPGERSLVLHTDFHNK